MQKTDRGGYRVVLQVSSFILYVKPLGNAITFRLDSSIPSCSNRKFCNQTPLEENIC